MAKFKTSISDMHSVAESKRGITNDLKRIEGEILDILNSLQLGSDVERQVRRALEKDAQNVSGERQKLQVLAQALDEIAALYESAENHMLGRLSDNAKTRENIAQVAKEIRETEKQYGIDTASVFSSDPVNLCTGNYIYEKTLLDIDAPVKMCFRIFYNNQKPNDGGLGRGWTHTYGLCLNIADGQARMERDDGSLLIFCPIKGAYYPVNGTFGTMREEEFGYSVTDRMNERYCFDEKGCFISQTDMVGNCVKAVYAEDGSLRCVKDQYGNSLCFEYSEGRISSVTDHSGRRVELSYENGCLIALKDVRGGITHYTYDDRGWLREVINPKGITALVNEYDKEGRTISQTFPDGGIIHYEYNDTSNQVCVIEQNGNRVFYGHDELYRNTYNQFETGEETFTYNDDNLRTSYTDAKGNISRYEYDGNGNLVRYINPLGDETAIKYTEENQLASVTLNGTVLHCAKYDERNLQVETENAVGAVQQYEYDEFGQPIVWKRPDGSCIFMTYDACGNLSSITNSVGGRTSYEYDSLHRVIRTTDPLGNTLEYEYNEADKLVSVKNKEGHVRHYEYDACGNLTRVTDFNGAITQMEYNEINKLSKYTDPLGNVTQFEYDKMWNLLKQTDPTGAQTTYEYDSMHHLTQVTDANGGTNRMEYDACGNLIRRTAPDGGVYEIGYDALNRPNRVMDACGRVSTAQYDAQGNVLKMVFPDGKEESCSYDAVGRQTAYTDRSGYTTYYEYDLMGNVTRISDEQGLLTSYEYYPGGLLKRETQSSGRERVFSYDANENIVGIDMSDMGHWEFSYDGSGNLTRAENVGGACETYEYDAVGNLISVTDGEGIQTRYHYSPAGMLDVVTDGEGTETRYVYDGCRRLISILQSGSSNFHVSDVCELNSPQKDFRVTRYQRDAGGNITKTVDPVGSEVCYTYDACGRILSRMDPDGTLTDCEYNLDGTERVFHFADGRSIRMEYDALRQLTQIEDWLGTMKFHRDAMGRPEEITMPDGEQVAYEWGKRGERKAIRYPDGQFLRYEYDDAMRLIACESDGGRVEYRYYPSGQLKERVYPFGVSEQYAYNDAGNPSRVTRTRAGEIIEECIWRYNRKNQRISEERYEDAVRHKTFYTYSPVGCLTQVQCDGELCEQYRYDRFGNRIYAKVFGQESEYEYNRTDQLQSVCRKEGLYTFRYDGRGNLTEELQDGQTVRKIEFNVRNLISRVVTKNGTEEYGYDGWGQRRTRTVVGTDGSIRTARYLYDLTKSYHNMLCRIEETETTNYFWDDGLLGQSASGEVWYFMNDRRMTPQKMFGREGIQLSLRYDSFGNVIEKHGGMTTDFGMEGYLSSGISGFSYANAREYDPINGRFLSRDLFPGIIVLPLTLNAYAYCLDDPLNYFDPSGMIFAWLAGGIVGAAVNVVTKAAGDVINSITSGEIKISSWQSYVGTAAGGFVSGSTYVLTGGNNALASAAGSAVETFATDGLSMLSGKEGYRKEDGYNVGNLLGNTAKSAVEGAAAGVVFESATKYLKIPGITKGQGSYQATWKQVMTKAAKGQIANVTGRTLGKGLIAYGGAGFFDGILEAGANKIKDEANDFVQDWLSNFWDTVFGTETRIETRAKQYLSGNMTVGECPVAGT